MVAGWLARQTAWSQVFVATHSPELMDPLTALYTQGEARLFVFQPRWRYPFRTSSESPGYKTSLESR